MSLAVALTTARNALQTVNTQFALSGRNVAGANDSAHSRVYAALATGPEGGVRAVSVRRAEDDALYARMIAATSDAAREDALLRGLEVMSSTIGDSELESSVAAEFSRLMAALTDAANLADDVTFLQQVITDASDLGLALNRSAETVRQLRQDTDAEIAASVERLNGLLAEFEVVNTQIVKGSYIGEDVTTLLDRRDSLVGQISEEIGVSTVLRPNNDMVLFTDGGVTLFETLARPVGFVATPTYAAGTIGNAVVIDGVQVTGPAAPMPLQSGRIVGLAGLRDDTALAFERQLDEVARVLVEAFAEQDQTGGGGPDLAGLFTDAGAAAVPAGLTPGLAGRIAVNPAVDPRVGGDLTLIRDGGINGPAYVYNTTGGAAFNDRLQGNLVDLTATQSFDPLTAISTTSTLSGFLSASTAFVEGQRAAVSMRVDYQTAVLGRAAEALSNAIGVNLDEEYAFQLELERSFAASSRLIGIVDELFNVLFLST